MDAPYRSERSEAWVKVKCSRRQEFVVAGFTDPEGSRVGLGALLLGAHDAAGTLRYAGKVGTGFDYRTLTDLGKRLGAIERKAPAVVDAPRARGQHWVDPRLVADRVLPGLVERPPLERRSAWDEVKQFAAGAAGQLVRAAPDRFTATMSKAKRPGKIFLDVFRNTPESTAIASWSTRARPGAPVAATLAWDELEADEAPRVTLRDAAARLERPDPWASFERSRRRLTGSMRRRVGAL